MNTRLVYTIYKSEELYNRNKTPKTAFLLILRYIEASIILVDRNMYLQKAMNVIVNIKPIAVENVIIKLLEVYINIEFGNYNDADLILKKLKYFKNWYKDKNPKEYLIMLMLLSRNEFELNHKIRAKRYYNLVIDQISNSNNSIDKILKNVLLGEYETTLSKHLTNNDYENSISPLMYLQILQENSYQEVNNYNVINRILLWSVFHEIDNQNVLSIINFYIGNYNSFNFKINNINIIELIYKKYKISEILKLLCNLYIKNSRIDKIALDVYINSKKNSFSIEQLDYFYILSAYENNYYDIEPKVIQNIISNSDIEEKIQAFIYHLILTRNDMKYMIPINHYKIINFGKIAFEKKLNGIYYNSIYIFMLENDIKNKNLQKYIFEQIFSYEITILNDDIKYIWVSEFEKENIQAYVANNESVIIDVATSDFKIYCLGQKQRTFYDCERNITIKKMVIDIHENNYMFFFNRDMISLELIIALSKYYMEKLLFTEETVYILKLALEYNEISHNFKCRISAALGGYFAKYKQYEMSKKYFSVLRFSELTDYEINMAILAFSNTGEIEKAVKCYTSRKYTISDKSKLCICIMAQNYKMFEKEISYISSELLLKGRSEKELYNNIINYYDGTIEDWLNIKNMLETLNIDTREVEKKILKKSIYIQKMNGDIQDIFLNVYKSDNKNDIINEFIDYIVYVVLTQQKSIKKSLVECLEKHDTYTTNNEYFSCAIASVYIMNNMEINNYRYNILEKSIEYMEKNNIMFPIFKEYKDKNSDFPYLEKNMPFIYNSLPNKEVYLYYRLKGELTWHKKNMVYEKFGLYMAVLAIFYNEVLEYYIEQTDSSHENKIAEYVNKDNNKIKQDISDKYYNINNTVIYSNTLKYSEIENIISDKEVRKEYLNSFGHLL